MIQGWVGDVLGFIKRLFKIGSPSKVMADEVGVYLAEGIGVGFEGGMTDVEKAMQNSMPDLQSMIQPVDVPVDFTASNSTLRGVGSVQAEPKEQDKRVSIGKIDIIVNGAGKNADQIARELQTILNRKVAYYA